MRFVSRSVLFFAAPLALAGCVAGPGFLSGRSDANDPVMRGQRLWQAAQRYEAEGQYQSAYYLYHQLAHEMPHFQPARDRMTTVAQRINQGGAAGTAEGTDAPHSAQTAMKMLAAIHAEHREKVLARQKRKSPDELLAEIRQRQAEAKRQAPPAAPVQAAQSTAELQPVVVHSAPATSPPLPPESDDDSSTQQPAWWVTGPEVNGEEAAAPAPLFTATASQQSTPADSAEAAATSAKPPAPLPAIVPAKQKDWQATTLARHCRDLSEELKQLVAALDGTDTNARIEALRQLAAYGAEAQSTATAVRSFLNNADETLQAHAAEALYAVGGDAAQPVATLTKLLSSSDESVVQLACYLLGRIGADARGAVAALEVTQSESIGLTKLHAAEALLRIDPEHHSAFESLELALDSDDQEARWFAALALGSVQGAHRSLAATALEEALHDAESTVRAAAALSLGGLGSEAESAIEELERIAQADDQDQDVRDAAATALACLKR